MNDANVVVDAERSEAMAASSVVAHGRRCQGSHK